MFGEFNLPTPSLRAIISAPKDEPIATKDTTKPRVVDLGRMSGEWLQTFKDNTLCGVGR